MERYTILKNKQTTDFLEKAFQSMKMCFFNNKFHMYLSWEYGMTLWTGYTYISPTKLHGSYTSLNSCKKLIYLYLLGNCDWQNCFLGLSLPKSHRKDDLWLFWQRDIGWCSPKIHFQLYNGIFCHTTVWPLHWKKTATCGNRSSGRRFYIGLEPAFETENSNIMQKVESQYWLVIIKYLIWIFERNATLCFP